MIAIYKMTGQQVEIIGIAQPMLEKPVGDLTLEDIERQEEDTRYYVQHIGPHGWGWKCWCTREELRFLR